MNQEVSLFVTRNNDRHMHLKKRAVNQRAVCCESSGKILYIAENLGTSIPQFVFASFLHTGWDGHGATAYSMRINKDDMAWKILIFDHMEQFI